MEPRLSSAAERRRVRTGAERCRRKFLRIFPDGFSDETYLAWERDYKWSAHKRWLAVLDKECFAELLNEGAYQDIAERAIAVEAPTNLVFSYEKMALRDSFRAPYGAERFAKGLYQFLYGASAARLRFETWCETVASLPRKQSRVLTWPILTVFGFIAQPRRHIYLKPTVMRRAAAAYGYPFDYSSKPRWETYASFLGFAARIFEDIADLKPRDMIDIQSFLWVQGSEEY